MASIIKQIEIDAPADAVWDAVRDFAAIHRRLVPGFVTEAEMEGDDVRAITFFNGSRARERVVTIDDERRRLVYTVIESGLAASHDNSSAEVVDLGDRTCRFIWVKDVLPDTIAPIVNGLMERGITIIKATMEATSPERLPAPT
jgi:Polyketide cyclase / dehydrase and lipid transport